jgi:hypothetical protein
MNKGGLLYYKDGKIGKTKSQLFLNNKSISCIAEDIEGGYWITSLEDGRSTSKTLTTCILKS